MWVLRKGFLIKRKSEKPCHKNAPVLQGSGYFIFSFPWIRFSPNKNKTGTNNFERFLWEKYLPLCKVWWYFDLSLLSQSMARVDSAHNHWFLIAQTQKIGILQVVASNKDFCDQSGKPSAPLSLIPSTYYHYFYTLPITWGLLNILTHYSSAYAPSSPMSTILLTNVIIGTNTRQVV